MSDCENGAAVATPRVTFVIPAFNEEPILEAAINDLRERLREVEFPSHEILISENGSSDGTLVTAAKLSRKFEDVRYISSREPNYGKALRAGIVDAKGEYVFCDEIDLCDVNFHVRALDLLETDGADMVVGSKLLRGALDKRPWTRHAASIVFNTMLHFALGFRGTDTHGLKAFRRSSLLEVVESCAVDMDMFPSELVIRAERAGLRIIEIPVRVLEKRSPTINLVKRVPNVLLNMGRLFYSIRIKG
jgi:glycosyltransferase involved in cell wall biosynthesis